MVTVTNPGPAATSGWWSSESSCQWAEEEFISSCSSPWSSPDTPDPFAAVTAASKKSGTVGVELGFRLVIGAEELVGWIACLAVEEVEEDVLPTVEYEELKDEEEDEEEELCVLMVCR
jgi:hypothetical protein